MHICEGLFSVANVLSFSRLFYLLAANEQLGPLQISLRLMIAVSIKLTWWRHQMETFSALLAFCVGIHRSPVNSHLKGQWRKAVVFLSSVPWINGWVNNREAYRLTEILWTGFSICSRGPAAADSLQWFAAAGNMVKWLSAQQFLTRAPFLQNRLIPIIVILSWISNHVHIEVWIEITDPFSKLTGSVASHWSVEMDK